MIKNNFVSFDGINGLERKHIIVQAQKESTDDSFRIEEIILRKHLCHINNNRRSSLLAFSHGLGESKEEACLTSAIKTLYSLQ